MMPIVCPLEIRNVGGIKIRFKINENEIKKYNTKNDDFPIFKLDNTEGPLGPNEVTYVIGSFRPLTNKEYRVVVPIEYSDGINGIIEDKIILSGYGYNPKSMKIPQIKSIFFEMPKSRLYNYFENNIIQKCGVSLEEIDFGSMEDGKSSSHTFILYNYSQADSLNFEFFNPGFNMKDDLIIEPIKGKLGPNSHLIIKTKLIPKNALSNYEGEIEIKINWMIHGDNKISQDKENLFIRVAKKAYLKDVNYSHIININYSYREK
jgi:hypothetical protein